MNASKKKNPSKGYIRIELDGETYADVRLAAAQAGLSVAEWAKRAVVENAEKGLAELKKRL